MATKDDEAMKPWYRSKTIWFNVAAAVAAFLTTALEPLRPFMTPYTFAIVGLVVGIVNVILRVITTQGITKKRGDQQQ